MFPTGITAPGGIPVVRDKSLRDGVAYLFDLPALLPGIKGPSSKTLFVPVHDKTGHFARLPGETWPFYTRYDVGMREMARARRRQRA